MKTPKQTNRNPDGSKRAPSEYIIRAARIAVDADGNEHRVEALNGNAWQLPAGMRWKQK